MLPQNKLCTTTLVGDNFPGRRNLALRAVQQNFEFPCCRNHNGRRDIAPARAVNRERLIPL
jgi:hypothetical protein